MNSTYINSYRHDKKLNPLSLLAQLSSRHANGCLQVSSGSVSWSIYLENGKLIYASNSINPFDRLDHYLSRLSRRIPTLVSAVRVQVRLIFEANLNSHSNYPSDYQAICWLVNQHYLNSVQAASLIEELAEDVVGSLLSEKEGTYQLLETNPSEDLPKFCRLDLRTIVEHCYEQLQHQHSSNSKPVNNPYSSHSVVPIGNSTQLNSIHESSLNKSAQLEHSFQYNTSVNQKPMSTSKTYKIACIDDSTSVLNAINSFLEDKSFSVVMINDPVRALMQVIRIKPDLILLDVAMPNLDGYELCSLLRKHSLFKHTPIIMVTGNTGFLDRAKAKLVGASGYLTKPFNQSDLLKIVFKHLK
ncbi:MULTISPECIES: response regulator [unclassified Moorena]|uniref:response regulator n=1 Tax=unclassified Moorena TaxID=2683338 RepID=UPI001400697F|nr:MULTISPECIES: response regulator [unclassified Moorena]NEO10822.1 response regulator [Moorena sp. SIO3E8]NEP97487.1 response regulator [Moorena sp. SIO3F7]